MFTIESGHRAKNARVVAFVFMGRRKSDASTVVTNVALVILPL